MLDWRSCQSEVVYHVPLWWCCESGWVCATCVSDKMLNLLALPNISPITTSENRTVKAVGVSGVETDSKSSEKTGMVASNFNSGRRICRRCKG